MSKFAVFDIDGTLIRWQLYHVVVNRLAKNGALGEDIASKLRQALMVWKRRESSEAYKAYERLLVTSYEQALLNIDAEVFDQLVLDIVDEYKDQTYAYTRNLVHDLKEKGYKLFIISGSHTEMIEQIGKYYGFDDWLGTEYERNGNRFTGKVQTASLDKRKSLETLLDRNDVTMKGSIAIGDTKSDIPMLAAVEQPIAFNPDKFLLAEARAQNWKIVVERKNVIYELESKNGTYILATAKI